MKSVLVISPFFFPEQISTGKYNTALVQALYKRGCEVTVLCSHPLYPQWKPRLAERELSGIRTVRGGSWMRYPTSATLRRLMLEAWFALHVLRHVLRFRGRVDVVVVVFPPSSFFAFATRLLGKRPRRVGIVHDLQGVHAVASSQSVLAKALRWAIGIVECHAFAACDKLVVLSKAMAAEIVRNGYAAANNVKVCYPFTTIDRNKPLGKALIEVLPCGPLHVVYAGALGRKQHPLGLLSVMAGAAHRMPEARFHIFSEGPYFEDLRKRPGSGSVRNLHFHPLVSEDALEELYVRSDIHIIPQASGTESASMPSKLPNIVISGRPVLVICDEDSELAEIVGQYDLGVVAPMWDPEMIAKRLDHFVRNELAAWKSRADSRLRREAVGSFSLDKLINEVLA
jgi:colanic acid biosynthesis glycosyl transferase WcaI